MAERNLGIKYAILKEEVPILNAEPVLSDKEFSKIIKKIQSP